MLCFRFAGLSGSLLEYTVVPVQKECYWKLDGGRVEVGLLDAKISVSVTEADLPVVVFYDSMGFKFKAVSPNKVNYFDMVIRKDIEIFLFIFWDPFHRIPVVLENQRLDMNAVVESVNRPAFNVVCDSFETVRNYLKPVLSIADIDVGITKSMIAPCKCRPVIKPPKFVELLQNPFTQELMTYVPDYQYKNCTIYVDGKLLKGEFKFKKNKEYCVDIVAGNKQLYLPEGIFELSVYSYSVVVMGV